MPNRESGIVRFLSAPDTIYGIIIFITTILAYLPAWNGLPIIDDDDHINRSDLSSLAGLVRIWTSAHATVQYYPLLHSVFWIEHHLWGGVPLGYHLVNILLHALSALLLFKIVRTLKIPGAPLTAAIFALHPIQVEAVAWMSELKSALSTLFFFGSILTYLRFDRERRKGPWAVALLLFIAGLMSKSLIAPLPLVLPIIFWWQRGSLSLKRDLAPLIPFLLVGMAYGCLTAWVESTYAGAQGNEFDFSFIERCLIAGRAFWFYLGKIVWPGTLVFIYPRWEIDSTAIRQYLFPLAAIALSAILLTVRKWGRAPLAALLYFAVMLFPAVGLVNIYAFKYTFVADRWVHLAAVGPMVLFAAGMQSIAFPAFSRILPWALAAILGFLTYKQCGIYAGPAELYPAIVSRNPGCWVAYSNLGSTVLANTGDAQEALRYFQTALQLHRDYETCHNIGNVLFQEGKTDQAIPYYREAVMLRPSFAEGHNILGTALLQAGAHEEAIQQFLKALDLNPDYSSAHNNLGNALIRVGRTGEAIAHFQEAVRLNPNYSYAHYNLGVALEQAGKTDEAAEEFRKARSCEGSP
jgi:tetratricopeptide (TPR) repeat protein